jgi:DNA-binding transcriptional LysR family regulator
MALSSAYAPSKTRASHGCERQGLTGGRQDTALLGLVAAGFGVGLVLGSFRNLRRPGVVYLPLEEPKEIIALALAVAWRRGDPSPGLANFLLTVREAADSPAD